MPTSIDFSKIQRIEPRQDSWDKVCARLDAKKTAPSKLFHIYTVIPLAASFILISLTVLLSALKSDVQQKTAHSIDVETAIWYNSLGETFEESSHEMSFYKDINTLILESK